MSSSQREVPRKAGWRGGGKPQRTSTRSDRLWPTLRVSYGRFFRWSLAVGMTALTIVLTALLLFYVLRTPRSTPLIVFSITDYPAPFPPNSWALEDAQALQQAWPEQQDNVLVRVVSKQPTSGQELLEAIDGQLKAKGFAPGGPKANVVLLYISAHGVLDPSGEPALVVSMPPKLDGQPWSVLSDDVPYLPIEILIRHLEKTEPHLKKVVLLESNRIDANWQLGILHNAFAQRLAEVMESEKPDNVVIINSASPGERSWTLPQWGRSAFAEALERGLAGQANEDEDRTITLHELRDYLVAEVHRRVSQSRLAWQRPMLLPESAADFALAFAREEKKRPARSSPRLPSAEQWSDLASLWERHEKLQPWSEAASGTIPHLAEWEAFQQGLLRLEQLRVSGQAYEREADQLQDDLKELANWLAQQRGQLAVNAGYSLPLAFATPDASRQSELLSAFAAQMRPATEKETEKPPPLEEYQASHDYFARAWAACHWVAEAGTVAQLDKVLQVVGSRGDDPHVVEMQFLYRLGRREYLPSELLSDPLLRAAVACRLAAERAAFAAGDPRVRYAIQPWLQAADEQRRAAEDRLYLSQVSSGDFHAITQLYEEAEGRAAELARAYRVRDRVWADAPYIAQWLADRASQESDGQVARHLLSQLSTTAALLEDNAQLASQLDELIQRSTPGPAALTIEEAGQAIDRIVELTVGNQERLTGIRKSYDDLVEAAIHRSSDPSTFNRIVSVLGVPLVSGKDRGTLWGRYQQQVAVRPDEQSGRAVQPPAVPMTVLPDVQQVARVALALVASSPEETQPAKETPAITLLVRSGQQLRARLKESYSQLVSRPAPSELSVSERASLSTADVRSRTSLALFSLPLPRPRDGWFDDPATDLHGLDVHQLLVGQAQRTLDDFWGSDGESNTNYYFAEVADAYLSSADGGKSPPPSVASRTLRELLTQRAEAARHLAQLTVQGSLLPNVTPRFERQLVLAGATPIPPGQATLLATMAAQPASLQFAGTGEPVSRIALPIPIGESSAAGQRLEFQFPRGVEPPPSSPWRLLCYYRGHVHTANFLVSTLQTGPLTVWQAPKNAPTTVKVQRTRERQQNPGSIAIVLDCSESMRFRPDNDLSTQMERAKLALQQIFTELAAVGNYRVSLWLYGHRLQPLQNDQKRLNGYLYPTPLSGGDIPPGVHLNTDVQRVWQVDRLTQENVREVLEIIKPIRPAGLTPLYYAMTEVIKQDLPMDQPAPRHLIVVTDGGNLDFTDHIANKDLWKVGRGGQWVNHPMPNIIVRDEAVRKGLQEDREGNAWPIELHVVGLETNQNTRQELQEVQSIARQFGSYHAVTDMDQLIETLRSSLGFYKYQLHQLTDNKLVHETQLDEAYTFDPGQLRQDYRVTLAGSRGAMSQAPTARLRVEGGEAIVLAVREEQNGPRLVHYPPLLEFVSTGEVLSPATPQRDPDFYPPKFLVAALKPDIEGADVVFRVAVQNRDPERFSPRPAEALVEITPIWQTSSGMERAEPYTFVDVFHEPNHSVPVLRCRASNWPAQATAAEIRLWFKQSGGQQVPLTPPDESHRVADWRSPGDGASVNAADLRLPFGDARLAVYVQPNASGGCQIVVWEQQPQEESRRRPLKVATDLRPDYIFRQQYPENLLTAHTFVFERTTVPEALNRMLMLTSLESLRDGAAELTTPLIVPIK